ncbi:MAG: RNase H family protein [Bacillota bacterium]
MPFIGESQLTNKIAEVNRELAQDRIQLEILKNTYRDYQVQFELYINGEKKGKGIVYFSEKKQSFRLRFLKLAEKSLESVVEDAFSGMKTKAGLVAYVDGSFVGGTAAYGAVILENDHVLAELSGILPKEEASSHQIGGELRGALEAVKWAKTRGYKELTICYDYEGVKKFATGQWKRESQLAIDYHIEVNKYDLKINWQKIAAHTGVKWNERADELAKLAAKESPTEVKMPKAELLIEKFSELLDQHQLEYENKGVINGQFIRLVIKGEKPVYFDLYDTKNRQLDPYIHGSDSELRSRLKNLFCKIK